MGNLGFVDYDAIPERENQSFDPLPPGDYVGEITNAELRDTSKGGKMIKLEITLENGRKVWDNLNVQNPNHTAQEIAQQSLRDISIAIGKHISDTEDMLYGKVTVTLKVDPPRDGYDARNSVKRYKATVGASRPAAAPTHQAAPAPRPTPAKPAAAAIGNRPWAKKSAPAQEAQVVDDDIPY